MTTNIEELIWVKDKVASIEVVIYLYIDQTIPKIHSMSKFQVSAFTESDLTESQILSRWSIPTHADMESYRRQSAKFSVQSGTVLIDEIIVSDWVVTNHMRELFIDGKEVELTRDEDSSLTSESLMKLKLLHAGLYDLMYDKYKAEACLFT